MPRKAVLSAVQQAALTALPTAEQDLRLHYTLSENDLAIIRSKRGLHNRLGFAIQLCYLRFPGQAMTLEAEPPAELLAHVARQIQVDPNAWTAYAARDETRREHALELQSIFGYRPFTIIEYRRLRGWLTDLALQTNKASALAEQLIESLRSQRIIVPAITMIDRLCAEALARLKRWSKELSVRGQPGPGAFTSASRQARSRLRDYGANWSSSRANETFYLLCCQTVESRIC